MHHQDISLAPRLQHGVYVADGWGIKIHVNHKHLIVEDGVGPERRAHRFHKATSNLERLVILGTTGYLTFDAIRWLTDAGAAYIHLDADGNILSSTTTMGVDRAKLRRAQALAVGNTIGIDITRDLLRTKIEGQRRVATQLDPNAGAAVARHLTRLDEAKTLNKLLIIEANAANDYWQTWGDLPFPFAHTDGQRVPDHWHIFGTRSSPISGASRRAANPANAILNYLYALLEAEARVAAAIAGLDPGIGILHADQPHRDNLALDLMEPVRPEVDTYLLDLLQSQNFRASDFSENRRGGCRIQPPLTHTLAATSTTWGKRLGPVIEDVIKHLKRTPGINMSRIPTPLTESNRRRGRDGIRRN